MSKKLAYPDLFQAVFEAAFVDFEQRDAPSVMLPTGRGLVRITAARHVLGENKLPDKAKCLLCLSVRDGQPESDSNRFTGRSPDGKMNQGGVYFSMHSAPMILETTHYSGSLEKALRQGRAVINLQSTQPLMLADLSGHDRHGRDFLSRLETRQGVRAALSALTGKSLWDLMLSPSDYSVARALGLAAGCHHYMDGLLFKSARTTPEFPTGDNVVLFGDHGYMVSARLAIDSVVLYQGGKGKGVNPFIRHSF